tara:strand:+ start:2291 stop:2470 length:180 start_codon:yes stop_codon:yes gene_type:complete
METDVEKKQLKINDKHLQTLINNCDQANLKTKLDIKHWETEKDLDLQYISKIDTIQTKI